jgi:hypothetical protein
MPKHRRDNISRVLYGKRLLWLERIQMVLLLLHLCDDILLICKTNKHFYFIF